jgi:Mat/Ecp fimbriae major subunit
MEYGELRIAMSRLRQLFVKTYGVIPKTDARRRWLRPSVKPAVSASRVNEETRGNTLKKLAILAVASAALSTPAIAAPGNTDSATGAATAEVVAPITITHDAGAMLDFGTFTAGTAAGTVSVDQAGNGSTTGDAVHVATSVESADAFTVTGGASRGFDIVAGGGTVTEPSGATMAFTTDAPATGTLDATGSASISVGGTLTVAANQTPGVYTGSYSVTATYN